MRPAATKPEWSDHNESDAGARVASSQTRVLVSPAASESGLDPCSDRQPTATADADTDAPARITFADGRHGRISASDLGPCDGGDPDRPVVRGSVPNPNHEEP